MDQSLAQAGLYVAPDAAETEVAGERGFAIVGLGYVGLPVALAFARQFEPVFGFDISEPRLSALRAGADRCGIEDSASLATSRLVLTGEAADLAGASFIIVAVPTPVDAAHKPDLGPLRRACELVGANLKPGSVVVFESTVYPGLTREFCRPLLAKMSGLRAGVDFTVGYSPERINPGDAQHRFESIVKIVAGEDEPTRARIAAAYGPIVPAGLHLAGSIEIAEAAKVIENTQRDINIALMNEFALILDRLGLPSAEVLEAARTKWNFLPFEPGLVGGHCIGVDPYYLTHRAETVGYHPRIILAGRRINDRMGVFIARRTLALLARAGRRARGARIGILGLAYKQDVPDARNSRVPDIARTLLAKGALPLVHDPLIDADEARDSAGIALVARDALCDLDALILAVPHRCLLQRPLPELLAGLKPGGVLIDVRAVLARATLPPDLVYWSL
jgi:UDP-N-acetyl-D-galactosamine dehydrogenase